MINKKKYEEIPDNDRFNVVMEGVAYYASVHTPNPGYKGKDPLFLVNLGLNAEGLKKAKKFGLTVYDPTDTIDLPYVRIGRKLNKREASEVKPDVVDSKMNNIPSNILIGNGSKVRVKFATYWWGEDERGDDPKEPEGGVGTTIFKVQVIDLVRYENGDDLASVDGGFSLDDATSIANEAPSTPAKKVGNGADIFDD